MSRIIDDSFLFQHMSGKVNSNIIGSFQLSQINSRSVQNQLRALGINTNSKQYGAALNVMKKSGNGTVFTNPQAIKNLMSQYDADGDYIDPTTGLAGLLITDENRASKDKIISIPESSRDEMFELTKKEFLKENGILNGDTTKRSDVYTNLYRKMQKNDRLAAGHTLEQYEKAYRQAFIDAVKSVDPNWEIGKPIKSGALDNISRESIESNLKKTGHLATQNNIDIKV